MSKTIHVPHLGGISATYKLNQEYDLSKPTCVLINPLFLTSAVYKAQFEDASLTAAVNLLAIEPLGHGTTKCASEQFTYWDSAIMALQVMKALGIKKAFAQGTSQGGWIVTRMVLLAPEMILGLVLCGTHMDSESEASQRKGCWNPLPQLKPLIDRWDSDCETVDFLPEEGWCRIVGSAGFGSFASKESENFWVETLQTVYQGDEGRKKVRMALICLLERDGLLIRLRDIRCPVHWLQGTLDTEFGTIVPAEQIRLFTRSLEAKLDIVQGGTHYLSATHPELVNAAIIQMVEKYSGTN